MHKDLLNCKQIALIADTNASGLAKKEAMKKELAKYEKMIAKLQTKMEQMGNNTTNENGSSNSNLSNDASGASVKVPLVMSNVARASLGMDTMTVSNRRKGRQRASRYSNVKM